MANHSYMDGYKDAMNIVLAFIDCTPQEILFNLEHGLREMCENQGLNFYANGFKKG